MPYSARWTCLFRRYCHVAVLLASAMLALAGCTANAGPEEADREAPGKIVEVPVSHFASVWKTEAPLQGSKGTEIFLNDDKIFVYRADNYCVWVQRNSGVLTAITEIAKPRDRVFAPVTLPDRVVFPSNTQIEVYDRKGKLMHKNPTRYATASGAAGDAKTLFIGEEHPRGGRLMAIDTEPMDVPRTPIWELQTHKGSAFAAAPVFFQGLVFAGSNDGGIYALRAESRDGLWPGLDDGYFPTGGEILADLAADKDGVYAASVDGKLYCLNLNTGRINWVYHAGRALREESDPVVTLNFVYIYVPTIGLVCIDKAGKQEVRRAKWTIENAIQFLSSDEKNAYLRTNDNSIIAVEKSTGQVKFKSERKDFVAFAVNTHVKDTSIYALAADGTLHCIRPVLKPGVIGEVVMDDSEVLAK
jgi:outer membrane protein assembly factor BamB